MWWEVRSPNGDLVPVRKKKDPLTKTINQKKTLVTLKKTLK